MSLSNEMTTGVNALVDEMIDIRRMLHAQPELSFNETATTAIIREHLGALDVREEACPTETGAVFTLEGGKPGRTVLLRADIDGLPVQEEVDLPFASRAEGRMHACGHDVHTATLLGVASALTARAEKLPGRYIFVFQPAEEVVSGAQAMVDGGLLERFDPAAAIGCHVASALPVGMVVSRPGLLMAACRGLRVSVSGSGGHGALQPRLGNVVLAVARFADQLDRVVADLGSDGTACVCSPGMVTAGSAPNVVPKKAVLLGTLRFFDPDQLAEAERRLSSLASEVAVEFDVEVSVEQTYRTDAVRNDPVVTGRVLDAVRGVLGKAQVLEVSSPVAASDDVSAFLDRVPGCYLLVGGALPDGSSGNHHSPTFSIDEGALGVGATALTAAAINLAVPQ
ncbi:MAG: M20 metallopeptidase family protein [Acidimicrobiales bacterium]